MQWYLIVALVVIWHWASFHAPVCHLHIFVGEISFYIYLCLYYKTSIGCVGLWTQSIVYAGQSLSTGLCASPHSFVISLLHFFTGERGGVQAWMRKQEENFRESVFSLHHVGLGIRLMSSDSAAVPLLEELSFQPLCNFLRVVYILWDLSTLSDKWFPKVFCPETLN